MNRAIATRDEKAPMNRTHCNRFALVHAEHVIQNGVALGIGERIERGHPPFWVNEQNDFKP